MNQENDFQIFEAFLEQKMLSLMRMYQELSYYAELFDLQPRVILEAIQENNEELFASLPEGSSKSNQPCPVRARDHLPG